ncbi:hypothetical protein [Amycolatopsis sp. PS_44_ISF1]|uniref:hypothetical protein n=1 Tax=Amycolatopsis sp. PS_44_ISF1 TaxID=2974917 RepID=UPI0028DFA86F|nr:hypothetical protein [Amycolatopsis sp. PS_44_ISF1]MDT8915801.1 hypothetical protein [Amycolatopsis sp. PS_44_ISF1]MDT8916268.1 hypothetical protein [Amycolatopsis sp. PS_44_ISF1]
MTKTFRVVDTPANPGNRYHFGPDEHRVRPFMIVDEIERCYGRNARREDAESAVRQLELEHTLPVGMRSSGLLTDARAVHARALLTAKTARRYGLIDAEDQEILADLDAVVARLARWQRTGYPRGCEVAE